MKKFFDKFQSLQGASLIGINGYLSSTSGEVANYRINANISVKNVKEQDLKKLENCDANDIQAISEKTKIDIATINQALAEMIKSAKANLSENIEDRTNQSQGQTDAYINLTPAIRLHKDTLEIHIFGQVVSKITIVEGEHKQVNSSNKTLAKKAITKYLDLRAGKLRTFKVGNLDSIKINGDTLVII